MSKLPIDVVPNTRPQRFVWRQVVNAPEGLRSVLSEGQLPVKVEDAVAELVALCKQLQAFKDWVHAYLDNRGVPHAPDGVHGAEGCRIGDRMDWVWAKLQAAEEEIDGLHKEAEVSAEDGLRAQLVAAEAEIVRLNAEAAQPVTARGREQRKVKG